MKKVLLVMALLLALTACGGGDGSDGETGDNVQVSSDLGVLGSGTNVFGEYASPQNVLGQVLEVDALNDSGMVSVKTEDIETAVFSTASGTTISEYASDFGLNVGLSGSYKYFSGSITTNFHKSHYQNYEYSFASESELFWKEELKIKNEFQYARTLKDFLTPVAAEAIASWTPADLFKSYGTHVLVGVYKGARLDYNLAIHIENEEDTKNLEIFTEAAYKGLFASADLQVNIDSSVKERMSNYERSSSLNAVGGSVQYSDFNGCDEDQIEYCEERRSQWLASIDEKPVFCSIMDNGLIPIWEFAEGWDSQAGNCAAGSRCQEIKNVFIELAKSQNDFFVPDEQMKISRFTSNAEEWSTTYDTDGFKWADNYYNHDTFGGHIEATDGGETLPWYFVADQAKYSGNMSQFYGGELSYHFRWRSTDYIACAYRDKDPVHYDKYYKSVWKPDVELEGAGGVKLGYFFEQPPDYYVNGTIPHYDIWEQWVVPITETMDSPQGYGWIKWCAERPCLESATEAELKQVLQNVNSLLFRGEYCFERFDRGLLDEVKIEIADTDEDDVYDVDDNCPDTPNPLQGDSDGDGIGDACDLY